MKDCESVKRDIMRFNAVKERHRVRQAGYDRWQYDGNEGAGIKTRFNNQRFINVRE